MSDKTTEQDGIPPQEAFELLSNEIRLDIIETLYRSSEPMSFTELNDAVAVQDSGRFNYHLETLKGQFVEEHNEGYDLQLGAYEVQNIIDSGVLNLFTSVDPAPADADCPDCGATIQTKYDDGVFSVSCTGCDVVLTRWTFPPRGVIDRNRRELHVAFSVRSTHRMGMALDGVCPYCGGVMKTELQPGDGPIYGTLIQGECSHCKGSVHASPGAILRWHPASVGFLYEHGIDRQQPFWELDCLPPARVDTISEEPLRVEVVLRIDGDELRLELDEDGDVISDTVGSSRR